jgi:hypothetical protein
LITFHRILAGCEEGRPEAWRHFLRDYSPTVLKLIGIYLPLPASKGGALWDDVLRRLAANHFEILRGLDHQAERAFLCELRGFIFGQASPPLDPAQDAADAPRPTAERVRALLNGLPLAHQEILFLKLAGYSERTLETILRITPSIAAKGLERLQGEYGALLEKDEDACLWPASWMALLAEIHSAATPDCASLHALVRILDGQVGWSDKDPVERHMTGCINCLERWTALREIAHWRRELRPLPPESVEALLGSIPVRNERSREPLLRRVFARK